MMGHQECLPGDATSGGCVCCTVIWRTVIPPPEAVGDRLHRGLPTAVLSLDGALLRVSTALAELLGRPVAELAGLALADVCRTADGRAVAGDLLAAARAGEDGGEVALEVVSAGERGRSVRVAWHLRRTPAGAPADITAVWASQPGRWAAADGDTAALVEASLRTRFEQSRIPQTALDRQGRFIAVNDAFCDLVGRPRGELLGRPVSTVHHPRETGEADRVLAQVLAGEQPSAQYERTLLGVGGRPVSTLVDLAPVSDAQGVARGAAGFLHDLSALQDLERRRQQQEDFFVALSQRASDLAIVVDPDARILYASPAASHVLAYEVADVLGADSWDFVHPDDAPHARELFEAVVAGGATRTSTIRVRDGHGAFHVVENTVTNLLDTAVGGIVCNLRDVTEQVEAEQALRRSEAQFRAIADTAAEGIWAVTPAGTTLYANARMADMLGFPLEELYQRTVLSFLPVDESTAMRQRIAQREELGILRYEVAYPRPDGQLRVLSVASSTLHLADGDGLYGSLAMVSDVTEARCSQEQLRHAALHDALTGLPNRALLLDRLEHALSRETTSTAVLFVDLDQFKLVNDSRGHGVGDDLLVAVAGRLVAAARPGDTVARFGGDEFVVVCEDTNEHQAEAIAQELLAVLVEPVNLDSGTIHIRASIGVAISPPECASDLLRYADTAMYSAKAAGRGQVQLFDRSLADDVEQRYQLAADLRAALAEDGLALHYQPIVDLRTGRTIGMEALARWDHPEHGPIPPARFVAVAEQAGFAPELDAWVIRRAMREAGALRAAGAVPPDTYVSINVSARNLASAGLDERIAAVAQEAGLLPGDVALEITEGAMIDDTEAAVGLLRRLRARGFLVALDDFGTGYSSLAYLRDMPITALKIDRSFVTGISDDRDALAIAASIADLARAIDVGTVAEGVETPEQAVLLRRLGVRAGQGWLWSRALPAAEILRSRAWLEPFPIPDTDRVRVPGGSPAAQTVGPTHGLDRLLALHHQGASLATIAAALNRDGYRTPAGLRWHRTSVASAIADAAYPTLGAGADPA
ncbi:MAG: hypothetical protein JWM48_544 [Mycobacterium sp.]|nr:hypothetical protein [Mycobacterium sp.]